MMSCSKNVPPRFTPPDTVKWECWFPRQGLPLQNVVDVSSFRLEMSPALPPETPCTQLTSGSALVAPVPAAKHTDATVCDPPPPPPPPAARARAWFVPPAVLRVMD